jgi:hypothetical protein
LRTIERGTKNDHGINGRRGKGNWGAAQFALAAGLVDAKEHLSGGDFAVGGLGAGLGDLLAGEAEAFDVELDGVVHFAFDLGARFGCGDPACEVSRPSLVVVKKE